MTSGCQELWGIGWVGMTFGRIYYCTRICVRVCGVRGANTNLSGCKAILTVLMQCSV